MIASIRHPVWILLISGGLLAACYINEAQESPGNDARQDVGLHIRLQGNFVLNRDGSRVVTTGRLSEGDRPRESYLIGLELPSLRPLVGPSLAGLTSPEVMLTPDPDIAWLVGLRGGELELRTLSLDSMTQGPLLEQPAGDFNAAILSGDGRLLVLAEVWDASAAHKAVVGRVPSPLTAERAPAGWADLELRGALFDIRFSRDASRMVALSVPVDDEGHLTEAAIVTVFDTSGGGAPERLGETTLDGFALNLVGLLTWAVRISPDGTWFAVSGSLDGVQTTSVFDLHGGAHYADFPCDGPVGFSPDSKTMVGFRDTPERGSELVISDLEARSSEATPLALRHPVYWIAPDGRRVVTYALGERGLVITDLDAMESEAVGGPEVRLREFAVGPDADFVYLVDGGALYLLDLERGELSELEPSSRDYDNINILPSGDALVLAARDTTRFELWSVIHATTERSVDLPTSL